MEVDTGQKRLQPTFSLLCCRACLATDEKLFSMHEYNLEFARVTGIFPKMNKKMPQHLCSWCVSLLQRFAAFREKCLRANECLLTLKGNLTTDSVRSIDRVSYRLVNLTLSDIVNTDCTKVHQEVQITNSEIDNSPIKVKDNLKNDLYIEIDSKNKHEIKFNLIKENDIKDMKIDDWEDDIEAEYLEFTDDDVENIKEDILDAVDTRDTEITELAKKSDNINKPSTSDAENVDVKVNRRKRRRKNEEEDLEGEVVKKKKFMKFRSADNDYMPLVDFKAFENNYNVNIVILNKEQQSAELAARRGAEQFRTAAHPCAPCGRHFRMRDAYDNHYVKHTAKAGKFECWLCKLRFKHHSLMIQHRDKHKFKFVCKECAFTSRTRQQAKKHHAWHTGQTYQCNYCGKVFKNATTRLSHVRMVHSAMNVACGLCGESFVNNYGLHLHRTRMHAVAKNKKLMQCPTCSITFVSLDALNRHRSGDHTSHGCVQCGENLPSDDALRGHVEEEHPKCLECSATFLNAASYAVHYERKHLGRGNAELKRRLEAERRARAAGLPPLYPRPARPRDPARPSRPQRHIPACCETCGKMFQNGTVLRHHQRIHTEGKLEHTCQFCSKGFLIKQQLKHHLRVHTGERPYKCPQCELAFTLKPNLDRHVRVVHLGIRRHSECKICGRVLATKFSLQLHVRTVHCGERMPRRVRRRKRVVSTES